MMRLHLACFVGATALFALVQGCSSESTPPPSEEETGEETPGSGDDDTKEEEGKPGGETTGETTPPPATTTPPPDPGPPPPPPKSEMTFFVTSQAFNGNLGGLDGADTKCNDAAKAVNGGDHKWVAYVSANGINAKDRIGKGPWKNQAKKVIAAELADLYKLDFGLGPDVLDEKGAKLPDNARFVFTGTNTDGTARPQNRTCNNWTSNAQNQAGGLGDGQYDAAKNPNFGASWSHAALNPDRGACNTQRRIYCFAVD